MFEFIHTQLLPYISGLYTLPWILVGFIVTIIIAKFTGREKIDRIMKKIGLILLYFFIPVLLFRIFLDLFTMNQIGFVGVITLVIVFMYLVAYMYAKYSGKKQQLSETRQDHFVKTMLTNQGRSSAFIGSAMMAYWPVEAGILMAIVGIGLFAVIPYILSHMHKKMSKKKSMETHALPWFLRFYPWYLILFVIAGIGLQLLIQKTPGFTYSESLLGFNGYVLLKLYTAITIPAALYYVGACIHPTDLKKSELRKLLGVDTSGDGKEHWTWVRHMFLLTVVITPVLVGLIFGGLFLVKIIPVAWFSVILINAFLPVTSTNMFLVTYGIDKRATAHVITWTTLICVPIVVLLISLLATIL